MAEEEGGGSAGGGKLKLIIIIVAVLLLLLGGAGAAYFFLFSSPPTPEEEEQALAEAEKALSQEVEPLETPIFVPLGTYTVNLKDGRRYLRAKIQLMMSESSAADYLTLRLVEIKDIVNSELQLLSVEALSTPEGKEELKNELTKKITALFPKEPDWDDPHVLRKVLFEEFYMQ